MASIDDLPLGTGHGDAEGVPPAPSSPGSRVVLFGVLVALVLAAGVWYYLSWPRASEAPASVATTAPPTTAQAISEPAPSAPVLPPLAEMDPYVRELFATLGAHPELLKWLATDDLVGAIVTAVDRLAQGQTPARDLRVLRPTGGFAVVQRSGVTRIDPASYLRYAPLVSAVTTVDPATLAAAFTTLQPRLEEAYIAQGHPNGGFDQAVRRAIDVVTTAPSVPADAALVPGVGGYAYADPNFERLPPAQKHLLRMGPDLAGRVREAVRQFAAALAAPAPIPR
ncbi:MAG: DUF3014 domain-containing protein [Acidobacteria bacterium]|nr:DUF3014 domain-containing protein [Acidobacteriota bacterium]